MTIASIITRLAFSFSSTHTFSMRSRVSQIQDDGSTIGSDSATTEVSLVGGPTYSN